MKPPLTNPPLRDQELDRRRVLMRSKPSTGRTQRTLSICKSSQIGCRISPPRDHGNNPIPIPFAPAQCAVHDWNSFAALLFLMLPQCR